MENMKSKIKEFSKTLGMDLFGVSGVDRFKDAPETQHPGYVLPGCKSVIVIGIHLLDGVVQSNFRVFEDGRAGLKGIYGTYGYTMIPNFELTYACYAIARFIEGNSDAAATPCSTGPMTNGMQVSIRHAAVAAGLGEFGYMSIVLTPQFGPRVRFGVILTTLELEPDPMYAGAKLCDPEKCGVCAKVCPTGAIGEYGAAEMAHIEIDGKSCDYARINFPKCMKALQAMTKDLGGADDYLPMENPTMEDLRAAEQRMPISTMGLQHVNSWNCGKCQTYCTSAGWGERYVGKGLSAGAQRAFVEVKK